MNSMPDLCAYCISPVRMPDFLQKPQRDPGGEVFKIWQPPIVDYIRKWNSSWAYYMEKESSLVHGLFRASKKWSSILKNPSTSLFCHAKVFLFGKMKPTGNIELWITVKTGRDRQAEDMPNFWVFQSLSRLVFCWSSPHIWHFYLNASPSLWPRYISSYWRGRANNNLYCLHDRGCNLKNKQFLLRKRNLKTSITVSIWIYSFSERLLLVTTVYIQTENSSLAFPVSLLCFSFSASLLYCSSVLMLLLLDVAIPFSHLAFLHQGESIL